MKKITETTVHAFFTGSEMKQGNTEVRRNGATAEMYLHGNLIATLINSTLKVSNAGWESNTTKERLNGVLQYDNNGYIFQKNHVWYIVPVAGEAVEMKPDTFYDVRKLWKVQRRNSREAGLNKLTAKEILDAEYGNSKNFLSSGIAGRGKIQKFIAVEKNHFNGFATQNGFATCYAFYNGIVSDRLTLNRKQVFSDREAMENEILRLKDAFKTFGNREKEVFKNCSEIENIASSKEYDLYKFTTPTGESITLDFNNLDRFIIA